MISFLKAKELLPVGDIVYVVGESSVFPATVKKVTRFGIITDAGRLDYEDHGWAWFLTKIGAEGKT